MKGWHSLWSQASQRWQQYSVREQRLLVIAAVAVLVGALYWGVWTPLQQAIVRQENRLQQNRQVLRQLQVSGDAIRQWQAQQATPQASTANAGSITESVSRSAADYAITVTRMQTNDKQLQLWLADLPFNQLLSWLLQLRLQQGIEVSALNLSAAGDAGVVRVERLQLILP